VSESWTAPFIRLLNGEKEEILLREAAQLNMIASAIEEATALGASGEDLAKLSLLNKTLESKINLPGTKAQLKPGFTKGKLPPGTHRKLEKLQLVFKWGGEVRLAMSTAIELLLSCLTSSLMLRDTNREI
jgi:inositol-hexakisphosphate/diphosphoinositol-pentakisphosphate 1-kinase